MNTEPKIEEPTTQEEPIKTTPRSQTIARIKEAQIIRGTRNFGLRLLTENHNVGSTFTLSMTKLRKLRPGQTNMDVVHSLRKLRAVGLLAYEIHHKTQAVSMRFLVK